MARLRVAVVADVLLTEMSGVGRSVLGVTRELAELDPERLGVTIVARRRPAVVDGLRFQESFAPRVPKLPNSLFALQRPVTLRDFDLVHYMDSRPPLDFPLGVRPQIVTQHGFAALMFGRDAAARRTRYINAALVKLARFADLTITPSESERQQLLERAPVNPEDVVAIHHGVEHDRFAPPADPRAARELIKRRHGIEGRYVLYVANYQYKKNADRLVQAFAQVAARIPDVSLVLAGWHTGRFARALALIDELDLGPRTRVLGYVRDDTLSALYGSAELFTLPSLHESFGMPVLEAMACGTPVVTSNVYSLPEVCGDAAEYVDPYSVDSIAQGLLRVLEDPARAAVRRERGLARASIFTWRRAAERHLECYERVAGR
jgi:glycosyltransferase involved in cell wall biosynthesis